MKKLLAVITAGCISTLALAQQDPQFSQNMFNRLYVNPAYAGANEAICLHALYRAQWVSYDGAPKTGVFGIDAPLLNNKVGVGLSIATDKIGFENTFQGKLAGNYKFNVGNGKLAAGVDFDFMQHKIDGSKFEPADPNIPDPSIPTGTVSGTAFDMGAGLYYQSEKLYIGASASHILEQKVGLDNFDKEFKRNYYGMIGYSFDVTPAVELKPSVFVKSVTGNTTFDINLNAHFNNRFWIGASYRNEDAIVALIGMNITEKLRIGYSYDFTTSEIKKYSDGSHEIMLGYCFTVKKKMTPAIRNVRFL
ncbi:type IX secretion system membrane protein PorP/SprF [soil metagenome]